MTITLSDFIEILPKTPSGQVKFLGKMTWTGIRDLVKIEFDEDPKTVIYLVPGANEFGMIDVWKVIS